MKKLKNGWTKRRVMSAIKRLNDGICLNKSSSCSYRNDDGNRCFIGVFIPDSLYDKGMEGLAAYSLFRIKNIAKSMPFNQEDATYFQSIHDCASTDGDISKEKLHKMAKEWLDERFKD
jgi:hypothetical protein